MFAPVRAGIAAALVAVFLFPSFSYAAPVQCECIRALRELQNIPIRGDAWTHTPNLPILHAQYNDVVLFDYGGKGRDHGAKFLDFGGYVDRGSYLAPTFFRVWECNYTRCECGIRIVQIDDPTIKGALSTP